MKKGLLLVNHFVDTPKFNEIYLFLLNAAKKKGILLEKTTNADILRTVSDFSPHRLKGCDFVLFWDKDILAARILEGMGIRLFNSADAVEVCDNKALTYIKLKNTGIKMPKTYLSPKTFLKSGFLDYSFLKNIFSFPVVVKENYGSFGKQVHLAKNFKELIDIIGTFENRQFIVQEFISSSKGRDIRVNVVGGQAVAAMLRYNENDFRANITNGAKMKPHTLTDAQRNMAVKAAEILGLDFGGIDILFGENGEPVFCEANSNAHFKNIYDCTGINVAEYIIGHIADVLNRPPRKPLQ